MGEAAWITATNPPLVKNWHARVNFKETVDMMMVVMAWVRVGMTMCHEEGM
jgi:hypothetical protein